MVSARGLAGAVLVSGAAAVVIDLPITQANSYHVVDVDIGKNAGTYRLLFDTGSASSWVTNLTCVEDCPNYSDYERTGYNVTATKSGRWMGRDVSIDYSADNIYGWITTDLWRTGPAEWNHTFVTAEHSTWKHLPADGFLGMAFSTIAAGDADTVVETLMKRELLNDHRFGLYYGTKRVPDGETALTDGVLTIGKSREDKYVDGDVAWAGLQETSEYQLWRTDINSVSTTLGKKDIPFPSGSWAIFDTGAGGISLPDDTVVALYESIGYSWTDILDGKQIPMCSDFNSTWSVTFTVDSKTEVTLRGDQLQRPGFAERQDACFPPFDASGSGLALFGTKFLRHFYTIYDFGGWNVTDYKPRIGFGKLKTEFESII